MAPTAPAIPAQGDLFDNPQPQEPRPRRSPPLPQGAKACPLSQPAWQGDGAMHCARASNDLKESPFVSRTKRQLSRTCKTFHRTCKTTMETDEITY
jgi:hypothetical protein